MKNHVVFPNFNISVKDYIVKSLKKESGYQIVERILDKRKTLQARCLSCLSLKDGLKSALFSFVTRLRGKHGEHVQE